MLVVDRMVLQRVGNGSKCERHTTEHVSWQGRMGDETRLARGWSGLLYLVLFGFFRVFTKAMHAPHGHFHMWSHSGCNAKAIIGRLYRILGRVKERHPKFARL